MTAIIETKNVTKKFGTFTAVDDVSLTVHKGEIYGFLGLNGAGKTTVIGMMLGMIVPTEGFISILGKRIERGGHGPWEKVGSIIEVPYSYPELTVRENLDIFRRLRNIPDKQSINHIMDILRLTKYSDTLAGHLSLGNSQRLGLAKAFIHRPEILILDEPSNGLDPSGIVEIRELLLDLSRNHGVTIFVSSHILGEISKIADKIGIIHEGKLLQEFNSQKIKSLVKKRLRIQTKENQKAKQLLVNNGYNVYLGLNGSIELTDDMSVLHSEDIATLLVNNFIPPITLCIEEEDLETYFLRIIGESNNP